MSTIAIIGGTGPQGKGLGYRFAKGGHDVILCSRSEERAIEAATELDRRAIADSVRGAANAKAAEAADLVLLAIPFDGHDDLVAELASRLAGKVVISCVNPPRFDKRGLDLGPTSAAENAQGPASRLPRGRCLSPPLRAHPDQRRRLARPRRRPGLR